ncbi:MAG: DUF3052 domain-containing protein [Alphaproteobacteria bacterium]
MTKAPDPSASAGHSGKQLVAKLGWKPEMTSVAIKPPANYAELVDAAPIATADDAPASGAYGFIHLFVRDEAELARVLPTLEPRLLDGGMIWVSWPKQTSPMFRDLAEDGIRAIALPMGMVDVKVAGVDADWSALKLLRRKVG